MKKCRYCGKNSNSSYEFCSSECENNYRTSTKKDNHKLNIYKIKQLGLCSSEVKIIIEKH